MRDLESIDPRLLTSVSGGSLNDVLLWIRDRFWDASNTAAPDPVGQATSAIEPVKDLMLIAQQAQAKNDLITELSKPPGQQKNADKAFEKYNKGPQRELLKHTSG